MKTPITIIAGYLGSGKTTLLRKVIENYPGKLAILMNEFGEVGIDGQIIQGNNIDMVEMDGGCVCCSMTGEFEAAIKEIIEKIKPDAIVVETTGVAEPDAIVFDIKENLDQARIDAVITVVDCDSIKRFPSMGRTGETQIWMADILLMNKSDLVSDSEYKTVAADVRGINDKATIIKSVNCDIDTNLLFGINSKKEGRKGRDHIHEDQMEYFTFETQNKMDKEKFDSVIKEMKGVYRSKGFIIFDSGKLFNYVNGRIDYEDFETNSTKLVFIGSGVKSIESEIKEKLKGCEI